MDGISQEMLKIRARWSRWFNYWIRTRRNNAVFLLLLVVSLDLIRNGGRKQTFFTRIILSLNVYCFANVGCYFGTAANWYVLGKYYYTTFRCVLWNLRGQVWFVAEARNISNLEILYYVNLWAVSMSRTSTADSHVYIIKSAIKNIQLYLVSCIMLRENSKNVS